MYKVIQEFKLSFKNFVVLTLNERIFDKRPYAELKKCRIDGKEYEIHFMHFCGGDANKMIDAMLKNFAIKAPDGVSFVGKEVEFV